MSQFPRTIKVYRGRGGEEHGTRCHQDALSPGVELLNVCFVSYLTTLHQIHVMKRGYSRVSCTANWESVVVYFKIDTGEMLASRSGRFTPLERDHRDRFDDVWVGPRVCPAAAVTKKKSLFLPGFEPK